MTWLPYLLAAAGVGLLAWPKQSSLPAPQPPSPEDDSMLKGLRGKRRQLRDFILEEAARNGRAGLEQRIEGLVRQRFGNAAIWITLLKLLLPLLLEFLDNLDDDGDESDAA